MPEPMLVVCAAALAGTRRRLTVPQVAKLPLIQMSTRPYAWRDWFHSQGASTEQAMSGPRVELFSMAVQAAIHGIGAALVPQFFVEDELRTGALLCPTKHVFLSGRSYFLVYPDGAEPSRELVSFGTWLASEAELYAPTLAGLAFAPGSEGGSTGE